MKVKCVHVAPDTHILWDRPLIAPSKNAQKSNRVALDFDPFCPYETSVPGLGDPGLGGKTVTMWGVHRGSENVVNLLLVGQSFILRAGVVSNTHMPST